MNTYRDRSNAQACGAQVASAVATAVSNQRQYQQLNLALDVRTASIAVGRMIDGAKPPPQTFKPADFLAWVKKRVALAKEVIAFKKWKPILLNPKAHRRARMCSTLRGRTLLRIHRSWS